MSRDRLLKSRLRERFVVTLTTEEAFAGLLYAVDERSVVLREAEVLSGERAAVDGELIVDRSRIAYMQRP